MPKAKAKSLPRQKFTTSDIAGSIRKISILWRSAKGSDQTRQNCGLLLTFLSKTQREDETAASFLKILIQLAAQAGIDEKRYVVSQFTMGTRDVYLRDWLKSLEELPTLEVLKRMCAEDGNNNPPRDIICNDNAFDKLFDRNVTHIMEKIFLSLDFESFSSCRRVCKQWNKLLTSGHFRKRTRDVYNAEMWLGEEGLSTESFRDLGKSRAKSVLWTSNGREVAFAKYKGPRPGERFLFLQYVDERGIVANTKLPYKDDRASFTKIYILNNVIVLLAERKYRHSHRNVAFVKKEDLTHRTLMSLPRSLAYLQSSLGEEGIIFAIHSGPGSGNLWLGYISSDVQMDGLDCQELEGLLVGNGIILQNCDTSCSYPYNNLLSGKGLWIVSCSIREGCNMFINKHQFSKNTNRFSKEWQYEVSVPSGVSIESICEGIRVHANSEYVFVLVPKEVIILSLEQGLRVKRIKLWSKQRKGRWSQSSVVTSERHLLVTRLLQKDEEGHPGRELWR